MTKYTPQNLQCCTNTTNDSVFEEILGGNYEEVLPAGEVNELDIMVHKLSIMLNDTLTDDENGKMIEMMEDARIKGIIDPLIKRLAEKTRNGHTLLYL